MSKWKITHGILGFGVVLKTGGISWGIKTLAMFVPSIAVTVRRLHYIGKNGWMLFIVLIPIVGRNWLLDLFVKTALQP